MVFLFFLCYWLRSVLAEKIPLLVLARYLIYIIYPSGFAVVSSDEAKIYAQNHNFIPAPLFLSSQNFRAFGRGK